MIKINKKIIYILVVFILLIFAYSTIILTRCKKAINNYNPEITSQITQTRNSAGSLFSDYENLNHKIYGQKQESEIVSDRQDYVEDNFKKYPDLAGYYLPDNFIDNVDYLDIDKDGQNEKLVYYSCPGCNAPSRNVDIIKNDRIIFSAQGGNLNIKNNYEGFPGFILYGSGLVLLRGEGYSKIKFKLTSDGKYIPYEENEIKYK